MSYIKTPIEIPTPLALISTLGGGSVICFIATFDGSIEKIRAAVNGAFTTSDIVITPRINTTGVTDGAITIANSGSGFGSGGSSVPSANKDFYIGDIINCTITGGIGSVGGNITMEVKKRG